MTGDGPGGGEPDPYGRRDLKRIALTVALRAMQKDPHQVVRREKQLCKMYQPLHQILLTLLMSIPRLLSMNYSGQDCIMWLSVQVLVQRRWLWRWLRRPICTSGCTSMSALLLSLREGWQNVSLALSRWYVHQERRRRTS